MATTKEKDSKLLSKEEMNDILLHENEFVILDIETTSLSPLKGGKIIEVAAVKYKDGKVVEEFEELIFPEAKISKKTTELTGITNEMVAGKRLYYDVLHDFYRFIGESTIVAHNANFDWNTYLIHYFRLLGIIPDNRVIDTLKLARLYMPNLENHKLNTICDALSIKLENHHRAIYDTRATGEMLIHFKNHLCKTNYGTYEEHTVQGDLFNMLIIEGDLSKEEETTTTKKEEEPKKQTIKVLRVKYWEKEVRKSMMRRLYINLNIDGEPCSCYLDVNKKHWYNKDIKLNVDFNDIQTEVLKLLKLKTVEDLCNFRN